MIRLWAHECSRVFSDRLTEETDAVVFRHILDSACTTHFGLELPAALEQFYVVKSDEDDHTPARSSGLNSLSTGLSTAKHGSAGNALLFADLSDSDGTMKAYAQIPSDGHLLSHLQHCLDEHNAVSTGTRLSMVLFASAREHVVRVARVLHQSRGHALLVGTGGSGRRSVSRLAAFLCGMVYQEYRPGELWKDALKDVMLKVRVSVTVCVLVCFCSVSVPHAWHMYL